MSVTPILHASKRGRKPFETDIQGSIHFGSSAVPGGAEAVGIGFALRAATGSVPAEAAGPFPSLITLGSEGGVIAGGEAGSGAGWSVASTGDVNADGYADLVIGAPAADQSAGRAYVLFGGAAGIGAVHLALLTPAQGFAIAGAAAGDEAGWSVAGAGDFNRDGFADVVVGARKSDAAGQDSGEIYLIFGHGDPFPSIDLAALTAAQGLRIRGADADDLAGFSVAAAGDVNGDGFADLIVGAPHADGADAGAGAAYLIFGRADAGPTLDLAALSADQGFVIRGSGAYAYAGSSVASAGDVNGDGFDDLIVGVPRGASGGTVTGEAYVVFGHGGPFGDVDLAGLDPGAGFVLRGATAYDYAGSSVASAGDVNGDGFDDLIVGARYADADYAEGDTIGKAYVVFGHAGPFGAVALGALSPGQGFEIRGQAGFVQAGLSVASAGDVNGDGFADLLIGAPYAGEGHRGRAYLIFGRDEGFDAIALDALTPDQGFIVEGPSAESLAGWSVASAGDVDGDGYDDLIVGAPGVSGAAGDAGAAYLLYGHATQAPPVGPPAVDLNGAEAGTGFVASFVEGGAGAALGQGIVVTAPGAPIASATITVTDAAGGDALTVAGPLPAAIVVQSGLGTGQLVLAGTGLPGDWAAALALVRYANAGANPDHYGTHVTRTIEVVVSDGLASSVPATALVTIVAVNDAPVANDDTNGATEDGAVVTGSVAGNDGDADGAALIYALDAPVVGLTLNGDGSYSFDPSNAAYQPLAQGATRVVAATYRVTDDQGATDTATLTIAVTGVNDAPDAANDAGATREDEALVFDPISLTANDGEDDDGDVLRVTAVGNAAGGAVVLGADGNITFTPDADFNGIASFDYSVSDGHGDTGIATVTVMVAAVNDAPGGSDGSVSLLEDHGYVFTAGDFGFADPVEGHRLAAVIIAALPGAGTLTLDGQAVAAGQSIALADLAGLVFTPAANGNGSDYAHLSFQVRDDGGAADGGQDTDPIPNLFRFDVAPVDDAPVISGTTTGDVVEPGGIGDEDPGAPSASGNLDFSDVDNAEDVWQAVTAGAVSLFGFGSYGVTAAGDWTYVLKKTHAAVQALDGAATLTDMFTMLTADGIEQIVTVTIHGQNDAPVNTVPGAQTLLEDSGKIFSGGNGNAIGVADVDAASLTVTLSVAHGTLTLSGTGGLTILDGANGSATMTVNGTAAAINAALDGLAYAPVADYEGADSLQVSTSDGGFTDTDSIALSIGAVNDAPTVSIGDGSGTVFAGDTFQIGTGPAQAFPSGEVTALANGGFAVVWTSNGLAGPYHAQSYDAAGAPVGSEAEVKGYVVVALEGGGFIAFWRPFGPDGDDRGILAQRYDDSWNEVGAEFVVNSVTAGTQDDPAAAALDGGGFVVTWTSSDGSGNGIFAQVYDEAGNRASGQFRVNTATANSQGLPKVEALPGGGFVVVWITGQSPANGGPDVFGQRYDAAGMAIGAEFRVNMLTTGIQFNPAVAVLEDGGFVVVWEGLAPDGAGGISGRRYDAAGNALSIEFRISAPNSLFQQVPDVTALAGGGFVVTWDTNGPGDGDNISALCFDSVGRPVGTEFRVDTVTESVGGPSIAGLADGGFAIAWTTDGATVHGRRMEPVFHAVEQVALDLKGEIVLGDVDAGSGTIGVTLTVASGILHVLTGTSGASVSGDRTASVTITGTLAQVNALLGADAGSVVSFTADSEAPPASTLLSVTISDNGNSGDGGTLTAIATQTIAIQPVNDAPVGADQIVTLDEDSLYTFTLFDLPAVDPEGNSIVSVKIVTLPGAGTLRLNGVAVQAGDVIATSQIFNGRLTYQPDAEGNGEPYASFTFQARDNGGTAHGGVDLDPTPNTVSIQVDAVNDAPVNTVPSSFSFNEDTSVAITGIQIFDVEAGPAGAPMLVHLSAGAAGKIHIDPSVPGGALVEDNDASSVILTGSQAQINATLAAVGGVILTPTANFNGPTSIFVTTSDRGSSGRGDTRFDTDLILLNIAAVNDAPVNSVPGAQTTNEDTSFTLSTANGNAIGVADVDSTTLTVTLSVAHGTLTLASAAGLSFSGGSDGTNDVAMTFSGTATAINAALGSGLTYHPAANYNGQDAISLTTTDNAAGGAQTDSDSIFVTVNPVNDQPFGADTTIVMNEDGSRSIAVNEFGFSDPVEGNAFLAVFVNGVPNQGELRLNGNLVVSGQTILVTDIAAGGLIFTPAANQFGQAYAQFSYQVMDDGGGANFAVMSRKITFDVAPVNDAPVNSVPGAQLIDEDGGFTLSTANGNALSVADIDAITLTVTLTVQHGTLTLASLAGLDFGTGDGTADLTMTFTGTAAAIDAALGAGLTYHSSADYNGPDAISLTTTDNGQSGIGGIRTDSDSVAIAIASVDDAPSGSDAVRTISEDGSYTFVAADFGFGDADGDVLLNIVLAGAPSDGQLRLDGVALTAFPATVGASDIAAGRLTFHPSANENGANYASFTFQVQDDGDTANGGQTIDQSPNSFTFNVAAVNDIPILDMDGMTAGRDFVASYTENGAPVLIAPNALVSDLDSADFGGGQLGVFFAANGAIGDSFSIVSTGTGPGQIGISGSNVLYGGVVIASGTHGSGSMVLNLNANATPAAIQALLRQVAITSTRDSFAAASWAVAIELNDGDGSTFVPGSVFAGGVIDIVAVDDDAVAQPDAFAVAETGTIASGNLFANDADVDGPALSVSAVNGNSANIGTQIVLASGALLTVNANGTFNYNPNGAFLSTPAPGSGASNASAQDSFTYTLAVGNTVTATITVAGLDSDGDILVGTAGDDTLNGGTGADRMVGGAGSDAYFLDNAGDVVIELANEGYDIIYAGVSYALAADSFVEVLATVDNTATTPLNLFGNALANYVTGNAGANLLDGGAGPDQLWGRGGDDSYYADAGDVVVEYEGDGYDILYARSSYGLGVGQSIEVLATIDNTATTAINLIGNALNNYIVGNAGANTLDGGGGSDQLWGREGDDSYIADMNDIVLEYAGQGSDILYATAGYILANGLSIETLATVDNTATTAINLTGNELDNFVTGNAGANTLDGGTGSDTLWGRGGDDSYFVDNNDVVLENAGQGNDIIYARTSFVLGTGVSVELLGTVDNTLTTAVNLTGNELANYVTGNAGANILDGGAGADQLFGRGGADTFAFTTTLGNGNVDQILDFMAGTDKIALDDAIFSGIGTPGSFNANAFFAGTAAHDLDDRIIYDQASGQLFYDADGNGAGAAVLFATLSGAPGLVASDFAVI